MYLINLVVIYIFTKQFFELEFHKQRNWRKTLGHFEHLDLKAAPCLIIYVGMKNEKIVLQPIEIEELNDVMRG